MIEQNNKILNQISTVLYSSGNKPDLDCYVFLRVNEDTDSVVIDEETTETG